MQCRYCGQTIPRGKMRCEYCGEEVRMVPDYNPLDEILSEEIKGSIYDTSNSTSYGARSVSRNTNTGRRTSRMQGTQVRSREEMERRRRQAEKAREKKRKKRRNRLIITFVVLILLIVGAFLAYSNSYQGVVKKGYKLTQAGSYDEAISCFQRAITKKPRKPEAYTGLSQVYIAKSNLEEAEAVFSGAVEKYSKETALYKAYVQFYVDTDQALKIPVLIEAAPDKIQKSLKEYVVDKPSFSLDPKVTYDDVQQLTLMAKGLTIYYTTDGTEPTFNSEKYSEPFLIKEGETVVKAIAVNKNGIPSATVSQTYSVELPIEDAPAVSPSTGQYEGPVKIEIIVPDGYVAYYTLDGTDPSTSSKKYTKPIDMPDVETLFKAVLVDAKGRMSGITTRNYVR